MINKDIGNILGPWQRLARKVVYRNNWIAIYADKVITPAASKAEYGVVSFANLAVGVVALNSRNQVLLVRQYRYPIEQPSWEIPEGGCPQSEEPLAAAKRELLEETGMVAQQWQPLLKLHLSNSITDEKAQLFWAKGISRQQAPSLEDSEKDLSSRFFDLLEVLDMIDRGEITDAMTVAAVLRVAREVGV
jgi:8-oxo-dGTP pyrophosphatase MutT (NUDIX family)